MITSDTDASLHGIMLIADNMTENANVRLALIAKRCREELAIRKNAGSVCEWTRVIEPGFVYRQTACGHDHIGPLHSDWDYCPFCGFRRKVKE